MKQFPLWQISRLRMGTDGHGVTDLVCSFGCPLNCRYCINPKSHSADGRYTLITPEELYDKVKIDSLYFVATCGGIMFGGGEPLLHSEFIREFRQIIPKEWSLYAETSLYIPEDQVTIAAEAIDHFYVDVKDTDREIFKGYTSVDGADKVIHNLETLLTLVGPDRITVRVPYIPDFNNDKDVLHSGKFLEYLGITDIDIFQYRV